MNDTSPISSDSSDVTIRQERLVILASALDEKIRKDHKSKKRGFLGLLLKILPPAEPFPSDCLYEVVACVRDTDLQLKNIKLRRHESKTSDINLLFFAQILD